MVPLNSVGQMAWQVVGVVGSDSVQTTYCIAVPVSVFAVPSVEALGKPGTDVLQRQSSTSEPADDAESETSTGTEACLNLCLTSCSGSEILLGSVP